MSCNLSFTTFSQSVEKTVLPERFTFPFYYQPHDIALIAIEQLQRDLLQSSLLKAHFIDDDKTAGKMFGVLVVQNKEGQLGYLSAFSGKLSQHLIPSTEPLNAPLQNCHQPIFVPAIDDSFESDRIFTDTQKEINVLNLKVNDLTTELEIPKLQAELAEQTTQYNHKIEGFRQNIITARKIRKDKRLHAKNNLSEREQSVLFDELAKESVAEKNAFNAFKENQLQVLELTKKSLELANAKIIALKNKRKKLSANLQKAIFEQYSFLNALGDKKNVIELFSSLTSDLSQQFKAIPSGAGDCAAPKLLHYAYKHDYYPVAMAEFWWGKSPKSAVRKHKQIYPACHSKCQPILTHMLKGLNVDENPLLMNPAEGKQLDIIYQDDDILVINKPADFLSVPGKNITDSVYSRIKLAFPYATGPLIVHRLDMSTSGLMVLALTKDANKQLQKQFIKRTVTKRYVALLSGVLSNNNGTVDLPLRVDLDDRPRQLVCYEYGKPAQTYYEVIHRDAENTRVYFYPKTGRTHQLRVHSAHQLGLNAAIVGDDHYGTSADRLHLHAEQLTFIHPATGKELFFEVAPDF